MVINQTEIAKWLRSRGFLVVRQEGQDRLDFQNGSMSGALEGQMASWQRGSRPPKKMKCLTTADFKRFILTQESATTVKSNVISILMITLREWWGKNPGNTNKKK